MPEAGLSEVADVERRARDFPSATVVICAYTERRWPQIVEAVASVKRQTVLATECVVVIDHNEALLRRAQEELSGVLVVPNVETRGLSGGRNSGLNAATTDVVVFLDDDAEADDQWLERLLAPYADSTVLGTGGAALPRWPVGRPSWFPQEFDWVVGCSYRGLPETTATVRNPIGANMSFRRDVANAAGGFDHGIGRLDALPLGCEETVFSIRARRIMQGARIVYVPEAVVSHNVSLDRTTVRYFVHRCVAEGLSKAVVSKHVGQEAALESERRYVASVLPRGVLRGLVATSRDEYSPAKAAMIVVGFAATLLGYGLGRAGLQGTARWLLGEGRS